MKSTFQSPRRSHGNRYRFYCASLDVTTQLYAPLPFRELVNQCWGLLRLTLRATFPTTTRAHPSNFVLIEPIGSHWPSDFWQEVVVPTMAQLLVKPPTYQDGWSNPMSRALVEGYLRRSLMGSSWQPMVDFTR